MSPNKWGPPVWTLFHTLAEKITDFGYSRVGNQLFYHIYRICNSLPCPDCAEHATNFLKKVNPASLKTKTHLKNLLYVFHNAVNVRKYKPTFHTFNLEIYKRKNLNNVLNNFVHVYNTRGNMKLLTESFQRDRVLREFKKWFATNYYLFIEPPPQPQPQPQPTPNQNVNSEQKSSTGSDIAMV
jgi:hypothetical protein